MKNIRQRNIWWMLVIVLPIISSFMPGNKYLAPSKNTDTAFLAENLSHNSVNELTQRFWQRNNEKISPEKIRTLNHEKGLNITITFTKGKSHNHPLMAFWLEDTTGKYIHSLYVAESIAKGYFRHGDASSGRWQPGPLRRPAALPYWGHQRGEKAADGYFIPTPDNPMPDAVSGATPKGDFILHTKTQEDIPKVFYILMEINQSWDWNAYWHNNKFPDDEHYKTSSQPALVYKVRIDLTRIKNQYTLQVAGHSHWSGANGQLYDNLDSITTALDIAKDIKVEVIL